MRVLIIAAVLLAGCFNPDYGDVAFLCDDDERTCPDGYACVQESGDYVCRKGGTATDAPLPDVGAEGGIDAGPDAQGDTTGDQPGDQSGDLPDLASDLAGDLPTDQPIVDSKPSCNNGQIDTGEDCDPNSGSPLLDGKDCKTQGYTAGQLGCKADCSFDTAGCVKVLDPNGFVISAATGDQAEPWVAYGASDFAVVWEDARAGSTMSEIFGARVSSAGAVLNPSGVEMRSGTQLRTRPKIAFDGTHYLLVYRDQMNASDDYNIYGRYFYPTTLTAVTSSQTITISDGSKDEKVTGIAYGAGRFLVTWGDERDPSQTPYAARIQGTSVQDATGIALTGASGAAYHPRAAFDGTNFLAVWWDNSSGSFDMRAARVDPASGNKVTFPISQATGTQEWPDVAWGGGTYLVAWSDRRASDNQDLYVARASSSAVTDAQGLAVATDVNSKSQAPAVAWGGACQCFLVVWQDDRANAGDFDIYGARVTAAGDVLDPGGFLIAQAAGSQRVPRVAYGGTFLVVWEDHRDPANSNIYGARVQ